MKLTQEQLLQPALKVEMELAAHEKECAMFRDLVHGKLDSLDKRMWRLEAMIMCSTLAIVAMLVTVFMGIG